MRILLACLATLCLASSLLASSPAEQAWGKGQEAMERDQLQEAINQFQFALRMDPKLSQASLSLAAAYLALGDDKLAAPHMHSYLAAKPEHFLIRMHYSELLQRLRRSEEAGKHLELVVRDMQDHPKLADDHLISCHTRLMEIAREGGDSYGEHLNRGIGLYLLARKRIAFGDRAGDLAEELLCKAAAELSLASLRRPGEARPCWYLHGVWKQLSQRQPAQRWLRLAEEYAAFSAMTPAEKRDLYLSAGDCQWATGRR